MREEEEEGEKGRKRGGVKKEGEGKKWKERRTHTHINLVSQA